MGKQTSLAKKRRGPKPTGWGVQVVARMQPAPLNGLDKWIYRQIDKPTRAEAIRRLVDLGLTVKTTGKGNAAQKERAKELAGGAIDKLTDAKAAPDNQARRKRRLLMGPEEFREARVDRSNAKSR